MSQGSEGPWLRPLALALGAWLTFSTLTAYGFQASRVLSLVGGGGLNLPVEIRQSQVLPGLEEGMQALAGMVNLPTFEEEKSIKLTWLYGDRKKEGQEKASPVLTYYVKAGDTLSEIARQFGTDPESIAMMNGLTSTNSLQVGQVLKLLTVKGILHKVTFGDTIWDIARRYGVNMDDIITANELDGERLSIGQELVIPGATRIPSLVRSSTLKRLTKNLPGESPITRDLKGAYVWPVSGRVTSGYGWRWGRLHQGIDISSRVGQPIVAARTGTVVFAGWRGGYGKTVVIDHGDGTSTMYAHCQSLLASVGQSVDRGETIARVGRTGNTTGPHLHFEVLVNGRAVNPMNYLR